MRIMVPLLSTLIGITFFLVLAVAMLAAWVSDGCK